MLKIQWSMPKASRAARRLSAEPVPTSKSRESEAAMVNGQWSIINDLTTCPDLAQTMVATCCGMGVAFRFSGLQSLRIKETDRLRALLSDAGFQVMTGGPWDGFSHWVEQAITRDIAVGRK